MHQSALAKKLCDASWNKCMNIFSGNGVHNHEYHYKMKDTFIFPLFSASAEKKQLGEKREKKEKRNSRNGRVSFIRQVSKSRICLTKLFCFVRDHYRIPLPEKSQPFLVVSVYLTDDISNGYTNIQYLGSREKHNSVAMLQKYKWNLRFVVIGKNEYKNKLKGTVLEKTPKHMQ